jgi:hypothetical protein
MKYDKEWKLQAAKWVASSFNDNAGNHIPADINSA